MCNTIIINMKRSLGFAMTQSKVVDLSYLWMRGNTLERREQYKYQQQARTERVKENLSKR